MVGLHLQNSRLLMTCYWAEIGARIATTDRCFKVQTGEIVMARYEDRGRKPSRSWTGDHELMMVIVATVMLVIPSLLAAYHLPLPPEIVEATMQGWPW
jgi:hypothetical protein